MEKIETSKIIGPYVEDDGHGNITGGNNTAESMLVIAAKVNLLIDRLHRAEAEGKI